MSPQTIFVTGAAAGVDSTAHTAIAILQLKRGARSPGQNDRLHRIGSRPKPTRRRSTMAVHKTCFACHGPAKDRDLVFTRY